MSRRFRAPDSSQQEQEGQAKAAPKDRHRARASGKPSNEVRPVAGKEEADGARPQGALQVQGGSSASQSSVKPSEAACSKQVCSAAMACVWRTRAGSLPRTLGQANRISGVNPADISILMVHLEARRANKKKA